MEEILKKIGAEMVERFKINLAKSKASGELENSIKFRVEKRGESFVLIMSAAKQLEFVDRGRKPGAKMPPDAPIRKWIGEKGIPLRRGTSLKSLSFLIRRSISIKGIKPTHVISITLKEVLDRKSTRLNSSHANISYAV